MLTSGPQRGFRHHLWRWSGRQVLLGLLMASLVGLASCASNPPRQVDNICSIFDQKGSWRSSAYKAQRKWGIPVPVSMAFIHRESSYVADAKPPRKRLLGVVPWTRLSSAYGYAQATDEAWQDYKAETDRWFVDRDNFADAIDFIGWYNHRSAKQLGIAKTDAYHLYLAYYSGPTGYRKGTWRHSPAVKGYATKVRNKAAAYQRQLGRC